MTERDNIDMQAWALSAFAAEPRPGVAGDTLAEDLVRGRAALSRRRRFAAGGSGLAVAAVAALAISIAPALVPSGGDASPEVAAPVSGPQNSDRSGPEDPEDVQDAQSRQLYRVAKEHFDPDDEHLGRPGGGTISPGYLLTAEMAWRNAGESGLGSVEVGIGKPEMSDGELRSEALCENGCEPRQLPDGSTAWVWQNPESWDEGYLGVAYRQADGDPVWLIVRTLWGNNSTTPVSNVDVTVDDALGVVADESLEWLPGQDCRTSPGDEFRPGSTCDRRP